MIEYSTFISYVTQRNSNLEDIQNSYILFKIEVSKKYKSYYSIFYLHDSLESIVDTKIELLSLDALVYF